MAERAATGLGFMAVLLWALLALFTDATGAVPPFQLAAMTFAIGGMAGLAVLAVSGQGASALPRSPSVWALGIGGLFGYHFLYFSALRAAPAAEASLIAYLWPLLIVLGSTLVTGGKLRPHHITGALLGFLGAIILVSCGSRFSTDPAYRAGYALALAAAFVWASYSVLSRRIAHVPTGSVTGFCLATAVLAVICHLAFEDTVWPDGAIAWAAVAGLGLGPVGLAFFLWDIGMKKGDIAILGAASYAAPLLSTVTLVAFGRAEATAALWIACVLITLGAAVAAKSMFRRGET
ncbi:MAG: EamA family transporter [Paracoccaceae bacterium]|nr:EamA family transporter [Paracoccaceae bacterium]